MLIQQLYTDCLSEAAYYIESEGEAAIIDPLRDTAVYLELAKERKASIKYIFETHFHADFVSGHLDLHESTGAPIVYGPNTETHFPIHLAKDGETFRLGAITIQVVHTPGHTLESTCYLVHDESGLPYALFTGDTLFVGDVGRPDLSSGSLTSEELASIMYDSLRNKILTLPDNVLVYPAHGAGSSCGKSLGPNTASTIGAEKQANYALRAGSREEFVRSVTSGLGAPPQYFPINARINKEGYDSLNKILERGLRPLPPEAFQQANAGDELLIVDTRDAETFTHGFIPGSLNIGLGGRFAEWAGALIPFDKPLLLVTTPGQEKETIIRLARVGFSLIDGYLEGGFEGWTKSGLPIDMIVDVEADELAMDMPYDENMVIIDVRRETEFGNGHISGAINMPLDQFADPATLANIEDSHNLYVHCGGGYRSAIACSLMKRHGIHNLRNVLGGWDKIQEQKTISVVKENSVLN